MTDKHKRSSRVLTGPQADRVSLDRVETDIEEREKDYHNAVVSETEDTESSGV